ncbi:MAG: hypothetical protein IJ188_08340 [Clostridia bacterium]|nr:hypothetical protein [Clostridia bacterium]
MPKTGAAVLELTSGTDSKWKIAGLVSEDGPSWTPYGSTESIKLWDLSVARTVETEKGSMRVPVISTDGESMKTIFGEDAVEATATGFTVDASDGLKNKEESYVLYGKDGGDDLIWTCAHGMVTEISEVGLTPNGAMIWEITITGGWKFTKDTPAA